MLPPRTASSMEVGNDAPPADIAAAVANKPDLEKQFDVIHFLQAHRSSGYLPPSVIYKATGIDLGEMDESVAKMLVNNPKIAVEQVPDPENPSIMLATYAYQAKFNHVRDRTSLLAQTNRSKNGVAMRDLIDAYDGVEKDLLALITAGDVLAIVNPEDKDKILFPRGEAFLVELDGIVTIPAVPAPTLSSLDIANGRGPGPGHGHGSATDRQPLPATNTSNPIIESHSDNKTQQQPPPPPFTDDQVVAAAIQRTKMDIDRKRQQQDSYILDMDLNPRKQIRRGEALYVGGQWFRVSSAVREGVPLSEQPVRAQAPLSVSMSSDLAQKNELDGYIRSFSEQKLPLDAPLSATCRENLKQAKEAREQLHKLAGTGGRGIMAGVAAAKQLLASHAHAANPKTLAASFGSSGSGNGNSNGVGGGGGGGGGILSSSSRKRPGTHHNHHHHHNNKMSHANSAAQARKDAEAAQKVASDPNLALYTHARRHGCTKDVRQMFLDTRKVVPESEADLYQIMLKHHLLEPGEEWKRRRLPKKANVDNDGKPKKRRYYERKNQRMTNTHLAGTEIGAILAAASDLQKQGQSVGDGGM